MAMWGKNFVSPNGGFDVRRKQPGTGADGAHMSVGPYVEKNQAPMKSSHHQIFPWTQGASVDFIQVRLCKILQKHEHQDQ